MRQVSGASRPDPAPSRWAYRLERLMLTPLFRGLLRVGLPFAAALLAGTAYLAEEGRREALARALLEARQQIETRPEFMVRLLEVQGATPATEADIRDTFPHDLPLSSFDLDLVETRKTIEALPPVAEASLRVRQGGVLSVKITERQPVALWRTQDGLAAVDIDGVVTGVVAQRAARPDLPLVAGRGATAALPEALRIFAAAAPADARVTGLVRVGERRWDLVLDRDQRILLPPRGAVDALERVMLLAQVQDLLDRDIAAVDMRLPDRPTIRMTQAARDEWRRMINFTAEVSGQ